MALNSTEWRGNPPKEFCNALRLDLKRLNLILVDNRERNAENCKEVPTATQPSRKYTINLLPALISVQNQVAIELSCSVESGRLGSAIKRTPQLGSIVHSLEKGRGQPAIQAGQFFVE